MKKWERFSAIARKKPRSAIYNFGSFRLTYILNKNILLFALNCVCYKINITNIFLNVQQNWISFHPKM